MRQRAQGGTYYVTRSRSGLGPAYTVTQGSPEQDPPLGTAHTKMGAHRVIDRDLTKRFGSAEVEFTVEEARARR